MAGGNGGGGGGAKADELVLAPHPARDQLPNVSFCITSPPPWHEAILLGFQHYIVMLGTTVIIPTALVPQMGGGNEEKAQVIQTLLFVAGINTLLQTMFGTRLPAVIGSSYTYVAPTISIILSGRWNDPDPIARFKKTMRAIQGALIIASTIQIILGFSGLWRNVARFLSPLSAVPLVALAGFGLYEFGFPGVARCVEIGLPQLILLVILSQYVSRLIHAGRNIFGRFGVLISVAIVWVYAHILTVSGAYNHTSLRTQASCRTDRAGLIHAAPWIRVPYPFQWGAPSFNAGETFAMMMAAFVALVESTGGFMVVSRYASATPLPPSVLSRGVGWQVRCDLVGKFGAVFASIPTPIVAALYCIFFAYVGAAGLSFLQFCNLNTFRTKFILGFSIFLGLSVPQYFNEYEAINGYGAVHTSARWFNNIVNVPFSSEAFVAAILAYILDNTLHYKDSSVRRDRGKHWWDKFHSYQTDTRSEEFYSLPFKLNRYFPSV
uniref:Nucleobase-ascorbate transporter 6 n=1 Tax=Lactuca sativa TaxID=4236 RepID=A0A9R1VX81_LACSA|nr:hypothetical protein LSAT_V11C400186970 [Lactuca sativa]